MVIPDRKELEKRLGSPYKLDGSFSSAWALEHLCETIRRVPRCAPQVEWIAHYMADMLARAYDEMGMTVERPTATTVRTTVPIFYEVDVKQDLVKLLSRANRMANFYQTSWIPNAVMGTAFVPWYLLANVFQNHAWAATDHDMIGNQRDRMDRAVPWLTEELVKPLELHDHLELAYHVSRALAWPPLGYHANEYGNYNLPQLRAIINDADAQEARTVLDAFIAGQNLVAHRLCAVVAMEFAIPPDEYHEARLYQEARQVFRIQEVAPFIETSINQLLTTSEGFIEGVDIPEYDRAHDAPPAQSLAVIEQLLQQFPNREAYHCLRGYKLEQLNRPQEALAAYERALELNPNYVQVYINRGTFYSRSGQPDRGAADFYRAREVEPLNINLRTNLLVNYYISRS